MYHFSFKVVDARIDARSGNSKLVFSSFRLRASSFDTSFDNDKPLLSRPNEVHCCACIIQTSVPDTIGTGFIVFLMLIHESRFYREAYFTFTIVPGKHIITLPFVRL